MAVIKAPNEAYSGQIGDVVFKDGRAETDNLAVITYCRGAGYEVDGRVDNPAALPAAVIDSRRTHATLGAPLRDAAADPRPGDFLPPVGAGHADPHGPEVFSPQIHASGTAPLVPSSLPADLAQAAGESDPAQLALVDQLPVGDAVNQLADAAVPEQPAGNASQEAWAAWVIARHPEVSADDVRATSRNDLRDRYGSGQE